MPILTIILSLVIFLNFVLGFLSISQNRRSSLNNCFTLLCFLAAIWTFTNLMTGIYPIIFWLQSTYAVGALVSATGLMWILLLTRKTRQWHLLALVVYTVALFFFLASFFPGFISKNYIAIYPGGAFDGVAGWGLLVYTIFFSLSAYLVLMNIILRYHRTADSEEKAVLRYVFYGAMATICVSFSTSFLMPLLNVYQFSGLDSIGFLIFLSCLSYAVIQYKLLDIKVVTAQLFTFAIWIILFIKIFLSQGGTDIIINVFVFATVVAAGILLIRSMLKEVRQHEQIEKMAKEVAQAYAIEKKANEELEKLDKFKDQFLMTTQHNLRTPLTSMRGYSDLLLNGTFGPQPEKTMEVVGKLKILTDGMIKMVNDFLDMAKFQLGKDVVALKPNVGLLPMLDEIIGELEFGAKQKKVELTLAKPKTPIIISADREKLKAALFNIIDNSVKYTPEGVVHVEVKQEDTANITVSDNGIGISKERLGILFQSMFERGAHAQKVSTTGSGIGLYLSGQIINSHKGKVWAESQGEGRGSTFHIELPLK